MPTFEESLKQLEAIVSRLERGDLPLEESIKLFEQGIELSTSCKDQLEKAEGKVQVLMRQRDGSLEPQPFAPQKP
jgi:exodeoxyribonuclease VII small subunit